MFAASVRYVAIVFLASVSTNGLCLSNGGGSGSSC